MKIEIFNAEKKDLTVRLKLIEKGSDICLVAVDAAGKIVDQGHILSVQSGGTIYKHSGVNPTLGFKLNEDGEVETY